MMMHEERESFAAALRETVERIETPYAETLYGGAVRRGRRIRRRRALATVSAVVVAFGAAGALAVTLSASGANPGRATAAVTGTGTPLVPVSASASGHGTPGATPQDTAGALRADVLEKYLGALPGGSKPGDGAAPQAFGPAVNQLTGDWYVGAGGSLSSSGAQGSSNVTFDTQHGVQVTDCAEAEALAGVQTESCARTAYDGGELIIDKERQNAADPSSEPVWQYYWYSPAGYETYLFISDSSVADFALPESQVLSVLTDPVWGQIAAALPAPACAGGKLTPTTQPEPGAAEPAVVLECRTDGKVYPQH